MARGLAKGRATYLRYDPFVGRWRHTAYDLKYEVGGRLSIFCFSALAGRVAFRTFMMGPQIVSAVVGS